MLDVQHTIALSKRLKHYPSDGTAKASGLRILCQLSTVKSHYAVAAVDATATADMWLYSPERTQHLHICSSYQLLVTNYTQYTASTPKAGWQGTLNNLQLACF